MMLRCSGSHRYGPWGKWACTVDLLPLTSAPAEVQPHLERGGCRPRDEQCREYTTRIKDVGILVICCSLSFIHILGGWCCRLLILTIMNVCLLGMD